VAQENMVNAVVGMLSTLGPCTSFYLFTLSSGLFRRELKSLFCIFNRPQQVQNETANKSRLRTTAIAIKS
jgi:hypothetical protein